jgi:hypothetical protein
MGMDDRDIFFLRPKRREDAVFVLDMYNDYYTITCIHKMSEWCGAFPDYGPLSEDFAAKLKRVQLNVWSVYGVLISIVDNIEVWGV